MKENKDESAFPTQGNSASGELVGGLTKREYLAGLAMQGLLGNPIHSYKDVAQRAINHADELLKLL